MIEIIPAILPKNYEDLKDKISLVRGIVPIVQIDICDGVFVKNITWPFYGRADDESFLENNLDEHFRAILNEQEGIPFWEDIDFELDLMVSNPVLNFDVYTKLGPKRIIFHVESINGLEEFQHFLEGIDTYTRDVMDIGIALNQDTEVEKIFPLVNSVDFVQVMGIAEIGFQGADFSEKCLEQIKKLKNKFPDLVVSIDGGVNAHTAGKIIDAGADRLVIGSAIFNTNDILETVEQFKQL